MPEKVIAISLENKILKTITKILKETVRIEKWDEEVSKNGTISQHDGTQFLFVGCNYKCHLQKCLKRFVFLSERKEIPFMIIRPLLTVRNDRYSELFFSSLYEDYELTSSQERILDQMNASLDHLLFSGKIGHPTNPMFKILEVQRMLVTNPQQKYTLSSLATALNFSPSWLSCKFREISGLPLKNFELMTKFCYSLWQIVSTRNSIKRIALEIEYKPLSFSKRFHAVFGVAPSEIRKKLSSFLA